MPCDAISASTLPASALIAAVEAVREAQPPVLFYLYDAPVIPTSVGAELAKLERCGTPEKLYHYGGSYWFLRQLLNHSWRVHSPEEASLLVVPALHDYQTARGPGGGGRSQFCKGLTPTDKIVRAINRTSAWRERLRDHVFVSLDWEHGRLPGSVKGSALLRGFVETRWSTPMTKGFQTRALSGYTTDFLLTVPYVDNGDSFPHSTLATQWKLEANRAFAPLPAPGAPPITRQAIRTRRNVTFFFGGRTSTRIGPGRAQMGYYVRWSLMRQWQHQHPRPRNETGAPRHLSQHVLSHHLLIIDSDRGKDWPAVRLCEKSAVPSAVSLGVLEKSSDRDLTAAVKQQPLPPPQQQHACLSSCAPQVSRDGTAGACVGHYSPTLLLRTRFALCLRGDIPSSPRPYDALRYGAIPIVVSDHVWRMGMPFQCWVPWREITRSINETDLMHDLGSALHNVTTSLSPVAEERMRELIAHFRRDVLWRHPTSRVAENVLMAAHRWRDRGAPLRGCCPLPDEVTE